jgi:hypothetical protein
VSEQLLFGANMLARKLLGKKRVPNYMPDFKLAFEHLCIHTGARPAARRRGRGGGVDPFSPAAVSSSLAGPPTRTAHRKRARPGLPRADTPHPPF